MSLCINCYHSLFHNPICSHVTSRHFAIIAGWLCGWVSADQHPVLCDVLLILYSIIYTLIDLQINLPWSHFCSRQPRPIQAASKPATLYRPLWTLLPASNWSPPSRPLIHC